MRGLFLAREAANAGRIFIDHAIGTFEIQKTRARGRVPAGSEHDSYALRLQLVPGAHDIIDRLHLMIDMLHARMFCWKDRDLVVHFIDSQ